MANGNEVKLVLTAEDNVSSAIKKITEYLGESGLAQSITAASTAFSAFSIIADKVGDAISYVNQQIQEGINDAAEAELVNKRLALSMANIGQYTNESFIAINDWAGALETATGTSDEALRSLVSLGIQYGMTTDQAKKAAEAALNLSAATGQDMDGAFRQIAMTLSGVEGRMGKFIPELRNLTKEQLQNGAAIDVISKKYDGFAKETANTYIGAQKKMESEMGNIKEAMGRLIAQNPVYIASLNAKAEMLHSVAEAMDKMSTWILQNMDDLKLFAQALGTAVVAVGGYLIYVNWATIAQIALNTQLAITEGLMAVLASPILGVVAAVAALTAGFYFLYKNIDLVVGAIKFGLGKALEWIMVPLGMYIEAIGKVVGVFNEDWGKSLSKAAADIKGFSKELQASGQAQMDAARAAKQGGKDMETGALMASRAADGLQNKIAQTAQEVAALRNAFSKSMEGAAAAFSALKELSPRMSLDMFKQDAKTWEASIKELQKQGSELKLKLGLQPDNGEAKAELEKINQQLMYAEEATKALRIKNSMEIRSATLKEEELRLAQLKDKELTVGQEIAQMRLAFAEENRNRSIEMETNRLLAIREINSADERAGVDVKTQALLNANSIELEAYKKHLEAQKSIAVDMESQKQLALAEMKASSLSSSTAGGAQAKQDVEMINAQMKQEELQRLREQNLINEGVYQEQLTQIQVDQITARTQMEVMLNEQRAQLLGQSPEALALRLEQAQMQNEAEMLILQQKYADEKLTDQEFKIAQEQAMMQHTINMGGIKEKYLQDEVTRNEKLKDQWGTTLAKIRLEQEKHGQIMGTVRGIQQSQEFQGMNTALSNTATLMQSKNAEQFKIGQAAAIAQAAINIPLSAINAYTSMSAIPIVGPALGIAASAAAVAAGMMQISQIKSQRPPGSQAHGGLDSVPKSMDNSTFLLKAGERVVQPGQNKELGEAVDKINSGSSGGHTINVTVNGNADNNAIERIKQAVMDGLREASERGVPVINSRGIVQG